MNSEVEAFYQKVGQWEEVLRCLGDICIEAGLEEAYKWKHPCYTYKGKNVVINGAFKEYCSMTFFKGVLLKDPSGILVPVTENVQADRQLIVKDVAQIRDLKSLMIAYIHEAIEIEESGQKVTMKETKDYPVPSELLEAFQENPEFKEAFEKLTPGRQRGYLLHFAGAKQAATRRSRILKAMDRIYMGKGINDCICGKSKHMPRCDGSHKTMG